jgi:hypothetical protein
MSRLLAAMLLASVATVQAQKRDTIRVNVGDTVSMGYSVSDTIHIKRIPGNTFVFASCGSVTRYSRDYTNPTWKTARKADSTVYLAACPAPPAPPVVVPASVDTTVRQQVVALLGPMVSPSLLPLSFAFYHKNFKAYDSTQWAQFGPKYDAGNSISVYERGALHYAEAEETGDFSLYARGDSLIVDWLRYLKGSGNNPAPQWYQPEGLYLYWLRTNDDAIKNTILDVANHFLAYFNANAKGVPFLVDTSSVVESRIQMRTIDALWMAEKVFGANVPIPGDAKGRSYTSYLDSAIVQTLAMRNANGIAGFSSTCFGGLNYMDGMYWDLLTRIHDQRPKALYAAAIETGAKAWASWLWATQWRGPLDLSFNYVSVLCNGTGSPTTAPDLNGTIVPTFGWLGKFTKDATWFARGDSIVTGMQGAFLDGVRQFQESYYSSYRYLGYRFGK